jgi:hypothetical protein
MLLFVFMRVNIAKRRIITIVDVFDAITSPLVYRKTSMDPDRALGFMMERAGKDFEPIRLTVFIRMRGFYPPGTMAELDSDELGRWSIPRQRIMPQACPWCFFFGLTAIIAAARVKPSAWPNSFPIPELIRGK